MARERAAAIVASVATRELAPGEWNWKGLDDQLFRQFSLRLGLSDSQRAEMAPEALQALVVERLDAVYEQKEEIFTALVLRHLEKVILLQTIDSLWKDHLLIMDHLKEGVGLSGYAQQNPLNVYKKEGFELFEEMIGKIQDDSVQKLFAIQPAREGAAREGAARGQAAWADDEEMAEAIAASEPPRPAVRLIERFEQQRQQQRQQQMTLSHGGGGQQLKTETIRREGAKVGRNDPCPCGSGKKYKKCCAQ
jgi:preprotein translocase subunit SecA